MGPNNLWVVKQLVELVESCQVEVLASESWPEGEHYSWAVLIDDPNSKDWCDHARQIWVRGSEA
jgi:hypothetical protein